MIWIIITKSNHLFLLYDRDLDLVGKDNVVGPVYKISCEECEATYVGETEKLTEGKI